MAEIQVERTKNGVAKGWAVLLVVLIALLGAGWYFVIGPGGTTGGDLGPAPAAQGTPPAPAPPITPATPPASAGGAEGAPAPPTPH